MTPFRRVEGVAAPIARANVDTDAIIPQRWLVTTERTGLGRGLFAGWRYDADGTEQPGFVLNLPAFRSAAILVAGANYGCGSSREHAVWAHLDFGIRAVIAPSFGPIFHDNAFANGLLPVTLEAARVDALLARLAAEPGATMAVDLESMCVIDPAGAALSFHVDPSRRQALLEGLDAIAATLAHEREITEFQDRDRLRRPWAWENFRPTPEEKLPCNR